MTHRDTYEALLRSFVPMPTLQYLVRMAERSKALRSGRSPLLWAWVRIPLLTNSFGLMFRKKNVCEGRVHAEKQNTRGNSNERTYKLIKMLSPRRGIEPRSFAWQAGLLTNILSRTDTRFVPHALQSLNGPLVTLFLMPNCLRSLWRTHWILKSARTGLHVVITGRSFDLIDETTNKKYPEIGPFSLKIFPTEFKFDGNLILLSPKF